jgi:hypothetical protein
MHWLVCGVAAKIIALAVLEMAWIVDRALGLCYRAGHHRLSFAAWT